MCTLCLFTYISNWNWTDQLTKSWHISYEFLLCRWMKNEYWTWPRQGCKGNIPAVYDDNDDAIVLVYEKDYPGKMANLIQKYTSIS